MNETNNSNRKAPNDIMKVTITCTVNSYIHKTIQKKDNTSLQVCNVNAYVITSNGIRNIRLVIYNSRFIKLFEKYPQEGTKLLVLGTLQLRTYEKDGIRHDLTEIAIGDSDQISIIRIRKKVDEESHIEPLNTSNNHINNSSSEEDLSEEFKFEELLDN